MKDLIRLPAFVVGLTLTVLGFGNWYTGQDKSREYERLLRAQPPLATEVRAEEFPNLTAEMNRALLRPLRRSDGAFTTVSGKLDFYRLVRSGGEMMMMAGLFLSVATFIHHVYRHHERERAA